MPSRTVVEDFIATIERGEFLEALDRFYAGERIVSERYFYDPAQRQPRTRERP